MFGDNIIPDNMLDGFYDKTKTDASNNIVDASNNKVEIKSKKTYNIVCGCDGEKIQYLIRPIDRDGNMKKKFW
jgi:hypothetical protein